MRLNTPYTVAMDDDAIALPKDCDLNTPSIPVLTVGPEDTETLRARPYVDDAEHRAVDFMDAGEDL